MQGMGIDMEAFALFQKIMDEMPGGFFVYHADGEEKLIHANQSLFRIFGCDTLEEFKELTGYTFPGLVHPDDLEMVERSIREQIESSEYALDYLEYRIIKKDGSVRWVEDYGHFIHTDAFGDIFYVFIDDATDRMNERTLRLEQMNRELRRVYSMEKQYKDAILHDAVSFFEANLSKDTFLGPVMQVVDGSPMDFFEYMEMEPIDKYSDFVEFLKEYRRMSDREAYVNYLDSNRLIRSYEKGEWEQTYDTWIEDAMGRKRLFRYLFLLGHEEESGDVIGLFTARDLTDLAEGRTLLELALEQAKAAKMSRNTFLSNISHDMCNSLNGIIGYAKVIREIQEDESVTRKYIDKIQFLSEQMLNIVNGSMEYSMLESGRTLLCETEGSILLLAEEIRGQVLPMSRAKGITFVVDKGNITYKSIMLDYVRLKEILYKLLDNAVKYTERGGEVRFSIREKEDAPRGYVKYRFLIEDTGIGMEEGFIERVFDPFERGRDLLDDTVIGSGLGLPVVKGLVDMMEGPIEVESRPGEGSRFTVTVLFRLAGKLEVSF